MNCFDCRWRYRILSNKTCLWISQAQFYTHSRGCTRIRRNLRPTYPCKFQAITTLESPVTPNAPRIFITAKSVEIYQKLFVRRPDGQTHQLSGRNPPTSRRLPQHPGKTLPQIYLKISKSRVVLPNRPITETKKTEDRQSGRSLRKWGCGSFSKSATEGHATIATWGRWDVFVRVVSKTGI